MLVHQIDEVVPSQTWITSGCRTPVTSRVEDGKGTMRLHVQWQSNLESLNTHAQSVWLAIKQSRINARMSFLWHPPHHSVAATDADLARHHFTDFDKTKNKLALLRLKKKKTYTRKTSSSGTTEAPTWQGLLPASPPQPQTLRCDPAPLPPLPPPAPPPAPAAALPSLLPAAPPGAAALRGRHDEEGTGLLKLPTHSRLHGCSANHNQHPPPPPTRPQLQNINK